MFTSFGSFFRGKYKIFSCQKALRFCKNGEKHKNILGVVYFGGLVYFAGNFVRFLWGFCVVLVLFGWFFGASFGEFRSIPGGTREGGGCTVAPSYFVGSPPILRGFLETLGGGGGVHLKGDSGTLLEVFKHILGDSFVSPSNGQGIAGALKNCFLPILGSPRLQGLRSHFIPPGVFYMLALAPHPHRTPISHPFSAR